MEVSKYSIYELSQTIYEDRYAVRDEVEKRQSKLAKQISAMKAKLAKAEKENEALGALYNQAIDGDG